MLNYFNQLIIYEVLVILCRLHYTSGPSRDIAFILRGLIIGMITFHTSIRMFVNDLTRFNIR